MRISNLLTLALLMLVTTMSAQSDNTTKAYILYKGYPYVVYLSPAGDIVEFIRTAPEVMKGVEFDMNRPLPIPLGPYVRPEKSELAVYNSPLNTSDVAEIELISIETTKSVETIEEVQEEVVMKPLVDKSKTIETKSQTISKEEVLEEVAPKKVVKATTTNVVNIETPDFVGVHILKFQGFSARLTPELIDKLTDINKEYKEGKSKNVAINSFLTQGDSTNKKLAENRMAACKDLLVNYGIPIENISTEILPYDSSVDGNVSIKLLD
ncbi:hypothetical protein N9B82_05755 [Saprospiraceae bacterium]|nr:hypothetical protein [Saprospiraceae bacterium]